MRTLIFHKGLSCTENYGGKISKIYLGVDLTSFLEVFCASLKSPLRSESEDGLKICVKCARAQIVARTLQRAKNQKSAARARLSTVECLGKCVQSFQSWATGQSSMDAQWEILL